MVEIVSSSLEEDVYPPLPSPVSPSLLEYPLRSSSWSPFESGYSSVSESLECSLEDDEDGSSGGPPAPIPISPGSSLLNELYPLGMYLTPSACVSCDLSRRWSSLSDTYWILDTFCSGAECTAKELSFVTSMSAWNLMKVTIDARLYLGPNARSPALKFDFQA